MPPTVVPCVSTSPRLLPILALLWCTTPYPPQAASTQPTLVLAWGLTSKAQASLHLPQQMSVSGWSLLGGTYCLKVSFHFALAKQLLHFPLRLQSYPFVPVDLTTSEGTLQCAETFPLSQLAPRDSGSIPVSLSLFFLSSFVLLSYMKIFLPFRKSEVFFQCSVDVLCK